MFKATHKVMNATLSQNVRGYYNEVPQLNITEQVQFTFKVDIHYLILTTHTNVVRKQPNTCTHIYIHVYK